MKLLHAGRHCRLEPYMMGPGRKLIFHSLVEADLPWTHTFLVAFKSRLCILFTFKTLSKTLSIDSTQDCIKPRLSYRPYGSLECIFLLHRVETRHFFLLLWYIYLSTLQQSLFLIYALFVERINHSLSAVVSKIPFNKWQSVSLTKENEVVNKENGFSRTSNIWRLRLSWK